MKKGDLEFLLDEIHQLAFLNPFGKESDLCEQRILSRLGWSDSSRRNNPIFTDSFNQVLHWVGVAEKTLLDGSAEGFGKPLERERMTSLAYFSLFHELIDDLDHMIAEDGSSSSAPGCWDGSKRGFIGGNGSWEEAGVPCGGIRATCFPVFIN